MSECKDSRMSDERRRLAALSASIAAMSGGLVALGHRHPIVTWVWLAVLMGGLIYVGVQFVKIRSNEKRSKGPQA